MTRTHQIILLVLLIALALAQYLLIEGYLKPWSSLTGQALTSDLPATLAPEAIEFASRCMSRWMSASMSRSRSLTCSVSCITRARVTRAEEMFKEASFPPGICGAQA